MTQRVRISNKPDREYQKGGFTEDEEENEKVSRGTDCHALYNNGALPLLLGHKTPAEKSKHQIREPCSG
jgi:hypothetical protein